MKRKELVGIAERALSESKSGRQDPAIELLVHVAETHGVDLVEVGREVRKLESYGIKVTPEIMAEVVARVRETAERNHPIQFGEQYVPPEQRRDYGQVKGFIPFRTELVYYARIGNRVKIGTTTNLVKRMQVINPEELMVTEPGGTSHEKRRHREFKELRTHGEWFKLEGALAEHIAKLQAQVRAA